MNDQKEGRAFKAICKVLGYSLPLVEYWLDNKPSKIDELNDAAKLIANLNIGVTQLELALGDWQQNDWRGIKGERPTPSQFAEHSALWWQSFKRTQETLEELNKEASWYEEQKQLGKTLEEIDTIIYQVDIADRKQDK